MCERITIALREDEKRMTYTPGCYFTGIGVRSAWSARQGLGGTQHRSILPVACIRLVCMAELSGGACLVSRRRGFSICLITSFLDFTAWTVDISAGGNGGSERDCAEALILATW